MSAVIEHHSSAATPEGVEAVEFSIRDQLSVETTSFPASASSLYRPRRPFKPSGHWGERLMHASSSRSCVLGTSAAPLQDHKSG